MPHTVKAQIAQHASNMATCETKLKAAKAELAVNVGSTGARGMPMKKKQKTEDIVSRGPVRGDILSSA
jgi:hypothetical protein